MSYTQRARRALESYGLDLKDFTRELKCLGPYVYHANETSVYIHFHVTTHKLRISNHAERKKYGYKWQLRVDGIPKRKKQKIHSLYFDDFDKLVEAMVDFYNPDPMKEFADL